jgi:hypothetical protein
MSDIAVPNQYSQGSLVTITVNTLDTNGNPVSPDNLMPPIFNLDYLAESGPVTIFTGVVMVAITTTFYYANIDSTTLSTGTYCATITWTIDGYQNTAQVRFTVLPFDGTVLLPVDPISRLRLRLRDNDPDPTRWVWSDQELSEYLQDSLDDLNAAPPRTSWFWFNVPLVYIQNILRGAEVLAMEAQAIKLSHSPIDYNDKGVSVSLRSQAGTYLNIASNLRDKYEQERLRIKRQLAYGFGYISTPNQPYISQPPIRGGSRFWNL